MEKNWGDTPSATLSKWYSLNSFYGKPKFFPENFLLLNKYADVRSVVLHFCISF